MVKYIILDFGKVLAYPTTGNWHITPKFIELIDLKKIDINFKKEVSPDTPEIQIDVAIDGLVSRHKIKSGDTENAVVITLAIARPIFFRTTISESTGFDVNNK